MTSNCPATRCVRAAGSVQVISGEEKSHLGSGANSGRAIGEAVKLGICLSPRTVWAYWPEEFCRPGPRRTASQHWRTFVHNHAPAAPKRPEAEEDFVRSGSGIIVGKDFSQVLSMPKKTKGPILADFRDIYDGQIAKEFGTGERKEWRGRITVIAGVTPDLDIHYSVFQVLGERFVQVRSRRPGGV